MFIQDTPKMFPHPGETTRVRQINQKLFAFVLVLCTMLPAPPDLPSFHPPALRGPPISPAGPERETFSQPIRSNLCFILRPNALDIVKINCLVHWANVLPSWCDTDVKSTARWVFYFFLFLNLNVGREQRRRGGFSARTAKG